MIPKEKKKKERGKRKEKKERGKNTRRDTYLLNEIIGYLCII